MWYWANDAWGSSQPQSPWFPTTVSRRGKSRKRWIAGTRAFCSESSSALFRPHARIGSVCSTFGEHWWPSLVHLNLCCFSVSLPFHFLHPFLFSHFPHGWFHLDCYCHFCYCHFYFQILLQKVGRPKTWHVVQYFTAKLLQENKSKRKHWWV